MAINCRKDKNVKAHQAHALEFIKFNFPTASPLKVAHQLLLQLFGNPLLQMELAATSRCEAV